MAESSVRGFPNKSIQHCSEGVLANRTVWDIKNGNGRVP